jgi:hypothetical protein
MSLTILPPGLIRSGQLVIGQIYFLHFFFGKTLKRMIPVTVRVVFFYQLPVCLFNFFLRSTLPYAQYLIWIF